MGLSNSNILATTLTADGSVYAARCRVKGIHVTTTTAGSVALKDGGSGGTVLLNIALGAGFSGNIIIPDDGVLFETNVYLDLTAVTSVTVFYQA